MKVNYSKMTEKIIKENEAKEYVPNLLLHSCCAPCSSSVLEYLSEHFNVTILFFNPNITETEEYNKRLEEQKGFIANFKAKNTISIVQGEYNKDIFYDFAKDYKDEPEGGERCLKCYSLRLKETAKIAKEMEYDYFTTTLSVSPMKNAELLNQIGSQLEEEYDIKYLYSDFKKKEGYKRSIELSKDYGLYRQDYCGCIYSKNNSK